MAIDKKYGKDSSQVSLSMIWTKIVPKSKVWFLFSLITDVPWVTVILKHIFLTVEISSNQDIAT